MSITLGYWNIRALAQSIRLLLKYTGTTFEEVRYNYPEDSDKWLSVKFNLGLDFPNLPYLIDGDVKITQSNAILRYIAAKHNMCGRDDKEIVRINLIENEAFDLRMAFTRLCFNPNVESMRADYVKSTKLKLENFSKFLGSDPWFAGTKISFVDFMMYEFMDHHRKFDSTMFDGMENLKAFFERFESLPSIKDYMASPQFIRAPINTKSAPWSGE